MKINLFMFTVHALKINMSKINLLKKKSVKKVNLLKKINLLKIFYLYECINALFSIFETIHGHS